MSEYKAYTSHTGIYLKMYGDLYVILFGSRCKRFGVFIRKHALRDRLFCKELSVFRGCVAEDQYRRDYARLSELKCLVNVCNRKKIGAEIFKNSRNRYGTMTVCVCLYDAAYLDFTFIFFGLCLVIIFNTAKVDLRPSSVL